MVWGRNLFTDGLLSQLFINAPMNLVHVRWVFAIVAAIMWVQLFPPIYVGRPGLTKRPVYGYTSETTDRLLFDSRELSPFWGAEIQQWDEYISALSEVYGFHPDLIAAIIAQESNNNNQSGGSVNAAGIMGITPTIGGVEQQSASQEMVIPGNDLRWGMAILSHVVQQAGGDLYTALAVYKSGWVRVNTTPPREYAARVLDSYARALIARSGLSPEIASNWTIVVELRAGNVPTDSTLVLGSSPFVEHNLLVEHTVYAHTDPLGNYYYVRGYVVPVGFTDVNPGVLENPQADRLEAPLRARLGEKKARTTAGNPRVLLACLPRLDRLRGQVTTRWYSPSTCPQVHR